MDASCSRRAWTRRRAPRPAAIHTPPNPPQVRWTGLLDKCPVREDGDLESAVLRLLRTNPRSGRRRRAADSRAAAVVRWSRWWLWLEIGLEGEGNTLQVCDQISVVSLWRILANLKPSKQKKTCQQTRKKKRNFIKFFIEYHREPLSR